MSKLVFDKSFTRQEGLPQEAADRVLELLQNGRLHRYNTHGDEVSEVALLEAEYAAYQGTDYCVATTSGGQAMQIALRAIGVKPGDKILANAYTLAPVPGAMHAVGGVPVFVEIDDNWHIDIQDLREKADTSGAKFLMLSHMRGHIADMDSIAAICDEFGITIIEDCAHTMGAFWKGTRSGNFGKTGCFSTQTYKHLNSGEGGFLTTNDPHVAARATIMSGSYMLYDRHGAGPDEAVFHEVRLDTPNLSARLDNLRATLLRAQLPNLDHNIQRWNSLYQTLEAGFSQSDHLHLPRRNQHEAYVGSSIQFQVQGIPSEQIPQFVQKCANRGVELKWFGANEPVGFTSRYDSWQYLKNKQDLPRTKDVLAKTCDMRVPLTFNTEDCEIICKIVCDEIESMTINQPL